MSTRATCCCTSKSTTVTTTTQSSLCLSMRKCFDKNFIASFLVALLYVRIIDAQAADAPETESDGKPAWEWVLQLGGIVGLIMLSGLFSGLTLGLMSLDKIGLEIVIGAGEAQNATESEKKQAYWARKISPVRENGNLLLTTLLLGNVAVNALLSIFLADLTNGLLGFLVSTAVIVLFGEIIPQALCSRHALYIGSKVVPVVKVIMAILYVLAKPVSWVLDRWLGEEIGTIHSKGELMKMLDIYVKQHAIDEEEGDIMHGAISYMAKNVSEVMTPIEEVFMLSVSCKLSFKLIRKIFESGYSRIPVWGKDRSDVVGLLFVKDLIFIDPEDETPVLNFIHIFGRGVHKVWPDSKLGDVLKLFKKGRGHLALVHDVNNTGPGDPFYEITGLVTLEDIIEEILQDEIVDETDVFVEVEKRSKVSRQTFDYGRLRLLDSRIVDETLSSEEVKAVSAHLLVNYPQFKQSDDNGHQISESQFRELIARSPVLEIKPPEEGKKADASAAVVPDLYTRGVMANTCTVILRGKVKITAGREGFESEIGAWSVLAADCLISPDSSYIPDFTATATGKETVRHLNISRVDFQQLLYPLGGTSTSSNGSVPSIREDSVEFSHKVHPTKEE